MTENTVQHLHFYGRQRQLEEERQLKLQQLSEARERKKREAEEYDLRLVQLAESDCFFQRKRIFIVCFEAANL